MKRPIGIISDFGNNLYLGIMKAVIKQVLDGVEIIDIDSNVPSFSRLAGSYVIYTSYKYMPKGSIILAVVDPGVGSYRKAIVVETKNYRFVCPDNGIVYEAALEDGVSDIRNIDVTKLRTYLAKRYEVFGRHDISSTFHGRDVFAPVAALLAGGYDIDAFTNPISFYDIERVRIKDFMRGARGELRLKVIYIDKFGNIVLSSKFEDLGLSIGDKVLVVGEEIGVHEKFSDVEKGAFILYKNSFGFVEISQNMGNASKSLGLEIGKYVDLLKV
ncbi:MAG: SAM-dependent chlorinase/fluorinase [Caldisphaeraceae archaeon]|nr:SAM-dependent chlorinase/fluorinase [Caldisphaeraceae archaeon]